MHSAYVSSAFRGKPELLALLETTKEKEKHKALALKLDVWFAENLFAATGETELRIPKGKHLKVFKSFSSSDINELM